MRSLVCLITVFILAGCSDLKELRFTATNTEEILEKANTSPDLSGEEKALLMGAVLRYTMKREAPSGKRIRDLIAEQRQMTRAPRPAGSGR